MALAYRRAAYTILVRLGGSAEPNLNSKIEVGDSLTGAEPSGGFELDIARDDQVSHLEGFKANF